MIKSLENIIKNKDKATYKDYKNVLYELESRMFPTLHEKFHPEEKIDGAKSYSDKVEYMEQIDLLRSEFPLFDKKDIEEHNEISKMIKTYNDKRSN